MTGEPAVEVAGLTVAFGSVTAVRDVSLVVAAGAATALVGRNGAGKSTTLRVLAGVVPPSAGRVRVGGVDLADAHEVRRAVGYCPDVGGLIPRATAWEHLELAARLRRMGPRWQTRAAALLDMFDLTGAADRVTAGFSHGMSRRLSVLLAGFHEPRVLLLDEPFDGVDPFGVAASARLLDQLQAAGSTIVLSTHLLDLAAEVCTEAVVLHGGRVVGVHPADELAGEAGRLRYEALLA